MYMYCERKQLALGGAHLLPDAVYTQKHICVLMQLVLINNALEH